MESPEKNSGTDEGYDVECIAADGIILPIQHEKTKQKMTTFWVSPITWKHVQEQRKLGETVDECLRRLLGIRRAGRVEIVADFLLTKLQKHLSFPANVRINGVSFDPHRNTVLFLLEGGGELPPVPEAAEPELITVNEQIEEYVSIESELDVVIEIIDDKGNPAAKPVRLPGATLGIYEKGLTLVIKKPEA